MMCVTWTDGDDCYPLPSKPRKEKGKSTPLSINKEEPGDAVYTYANAARDPLWDCCLCNVVEHATIAEK